MASNRGRFQPGNKAAYVHGGRSSRNGDANGAETVERLRTESLQSYPWLASNPVLLERLVSDLSEVEHYAKRVAEHEQYRRARQAQQSREHKAKAAGAVRETLRLVESSRTSSSIPGVESWQFAQARLAVMRAHRLGETLPAPEVALLGGEAEAKRIIEHKTRIADIYQKRRAGEPFTVEEEALFLENERLRIAAGGRPL